MCKNTLLYGYYGGIYIGRDVAMDANGTSLVGYGYKGSPNSQNRVINEITFGFNQTIWSSPRYGAINLMGQYEWLIARSVVRGSPARPRARTTTRSIRISGTRCRVRHRTSNRFVTRLQYWGGRLTSGPPQLFIDSGGDKDL